MLHKLCFICLYMCEGKPTELNNYFRLPLLEPSARKVFFFGLWSREMLGGRVRRGKEEMAQAD